MNKYIFVAYFTKNTPYEKEVLKLKGSMDSLNLKYDIQAYPSRGSWQANIAFKPEFVLSMLCKYPLLDVVYVDADAIVRSNPIYFDTFTGDIGVHYKDGHELLSGTIYFRNNPKVLSLVKFWVSEQQHHPQVWDQKTLQHVISRFHKQLGIDVIHIPATYTQIYDTMKNCGTPVIEHFQASRQYKHCETDKACYPTVVEGCKIRILADGTFSIPRSCQKAEKILDGMYPRVPNELRWYPSDPGGKRIKELASVFRGKSCYIVGKGPSLDYLQKEDFDQVSPIIAVNEAIHKVESLGLSNQTFIMQQDTWLKETCRPKKADIILMYRARGLYLNMPNRYIFLPTEVGAPVACLTASYAICMVRMHKCNKITMMCFDACVNHQTDYAKCVGYKPTSAGDPARFLKHRKAFELYLGNTPVVWAIPKAHA